MRKWILFFLLGTLVFFSSGCVDKVMQKIDQIQKIYGGTKTQPAQQTGEEQTTLPTGLPTGPRMCITQYPGTKTIATSYDDGVNRMRIENSDGKKTLITVVKDGYSLAKVSEDDRLKEEYPGCDWVATPASTESIREGAESVAEIYKDQPDFKFTCTPWVVDESMFETPGKVCFSK